MKHLTELYDGPTGFYPKVDILYEENYWDGVISGKCVIPETNRIFQFDQEREDFFIHYNDNNYDDPTFQFDKKEDGPIEEFYKECDAIRIYRVFWMPDDIIKKCIKATQMWEDYSRCSWGKEIGTDVKEEKEKTDKFKESMERLNENEEYKQLKEDIKIADTCNNDRCCGYFIDRCSFTNNYWRRLEHVPKEYSKNIHILKEVI